MDVNEYWITDEVRYGWKFVHDDTRVTTATEDGEAIAAGKLQQAKNIALLVSPMLSCEDAWLLAQLVRGLDDNAIIGIGPVPIEGKDKTFPSGFTVRSEKAPNARGVQRAIGGNAILYDEWQEAAKKSDTMIVTGNYPTVWDTPKVGKNKTLILIDTLTNKLTDRADVFLPATTWAEKSGTFENYNNVLQLFEQAIQPIGNSKSESQIAMDLQALVDDSLSTTFNAATVRNRMADAGIQGMLDVEAPKDTTRLETDMPLMEV